MNEVIALHAGKRCGRLILIKQSGSRANRRIWECLCDCGNTTHVISSNLRTGTTQSCGCLQRERTSKARKTHGEGNKTKEYRAWAGMKKRCYNRNERCFKHYGGRGITVCERWRHSYENFLADMGRCPTGHSLERIDNSKSYSPDNCMWATKIVQANNTRRNRLLEHGGNRLTVSQWSRQTGISVSVLHHRLKRGWTVSDAITTPIRHCA